MSTSLPVSPYDTCQGLVYFPRMIDKIRLHSSGQLGEDYVPNLGKGFDVRCCSLLGVNYEELAKAVGSSMNDEQAWEWISKNGKAPTEEQIEVWNGFMTRRGWNDDLVEILEKRKKEGGFENRTEIRTMFDYIDADEGREIRKN
jgi:gluconokinase